MIFVDTSVLVHAVGRPHPLRDTARGLLLDASGKGKPLVTSSEVLQELLHVYLPVNRTETLDDAWALARSVTSEVWAVEPEDVELARLSIRTHPALSARDLVHLASCRRRGVSRIHTFDRALGVAVGGR